MNKWKEGRRRGKEGGGVDRREGGGKPGREGRRIRSIPPGAIS